MKNCNKANPRTDVSMWSGWTIWDVIKSPTCVHSVAPTDRTPLALAPSPDGSKWTLAFGPEEFYIVDDDQLAAALAQRGTDAVITTDAKQTSRLLGDRRDLVAGLCCLRSMVRILYNRACPSDDKAKKTAPPSPWEFASELGLDPHPSAGNRTLRLPELYFQLRAKLKEGGLLPVFDLEHGLTPITDSMHRTGIGIDKAKMEMVLNAQETVKTESLSALRQTLGRPELNPNCNEELLAALRDAGLNIERTNREAIENIDHPAVSQLLGYRDAETIIRAAQHCLEAVDSGGRIHPDWDALGTSTGRFSCSKPAFQAFVSAPEFMSCLVPEQGNVFVCADYSGADLRPLAFLGKDGMMISALQPGFDFHRWVIAMLKRADMQSVTQAERKMSKEIFFGLTFGMGDRRLATRVSRSTGIPCRPDEAAQWKQDLLDLFPGLKAWRDQQNAAAATAAEVRTLSGRRAILPTGDNLKGYRFRTLINHPAQGTVADAIKQAMVDVFYKLPTGAYLVANRHDELIVECPQTEAEGVKALLVEAMTNSLAAMVPGVAVRVVADTVNNLAK